MTEIVAVDIGGTHARFAIARLAGSRVAALGDAVTLKTADHPGIEGAWREFARRLGRPLPSAAGIALAGPVHGEALKLTNSDWVIRPASMATELGVERFALVNDFGAVAHAVAQLGPDAFTHLCGPQRTLPEDGVITVVGPGTGLGVAQLLRRGGPYDVVETEGGHIDWAPLDDVEDRILRRLRSRFGRISVERVLSGPGLANLYAAILEPVDGALEYQAERELWHAVMTGSDPLAAAALGRFCLILGSVAGDLALAQGGDAVVIGGGLGQRLAGHLPGSGFDERFVAKGRFEERMRQTPVKIIRHPQPGLFGAAAAFAARYAG